MTTKAEWIALAERCEGATEPDREIERCMCSLIPDGFQTIPFSGFTSSLDAITALIEGELPEMRWLCRTDTLGGFGNLYRRQNPDRSWPCFAFTPALALCAAFCRAMAEKVTA